MRKRIKTTLGRLGKFLHGVLLPPMTPEEAERFAKYPDYWGPF